MGMERPAMSHRYNGGANMRSSGVRATTLAHVDLDGTPAEAVDRGSRDLLGSTHDRPGRTLHPPFERTGARGLSTNPG